MQAQTAMKNFLFYNAASSESFGGTGDLPANEKTPFNPKSPYGVAKASSFWQVANYRESYDLYACSGILFNHESNLRPKYNIDLAPLKNNILSGWIFYQASPNRIIKL